MKDGDADEKKAAISDQMLCMQYLILHSTLAHVFAVGARPHDCVVQLAVGGEVHQDQPALHAPAINS